MGVVAIFCGTWFRNLTDLNKHTNVMYDCGLKRLPPAVRVNNFTPSETRSTPASGSAIGDQQVIKFKGLNAEPFSEYMKGNSYEKACKIALRNYPSC